jgi:hypothetical protein
MAQVRPNGKSSSRTFASVRRCIATKMIGGISMYGHVSVHQDVGIPNFCSVLQKKKMEKLN